MAPSMVQINRKQAGRKKIPRIKQKAPKNSENAARNPKKMGKGSPESSPSIGHRMGFIILGYPWTIKTRPIPSRINKSPKPEKRSIQQETKGIFMFRPFSRLPQIELKFLYSFKKNLFISITYSFSILKLKCSDILPFISC